MRGLKSLDLTKIKEVGNDSKRILKSAFKSRKAY